MDPKSKRSFLALLFVTTMDNFGFGLVIVMFAPLLLTPEYHFLKADTSLAMRNIYLGILFAAYPLTQLFGAPILGDYADIAGRKKALYITIIGVVAGFLFSGVASLMYSYPLLLISRLFSGFFAGNLSICLAAIADLSPTESLRARNFGWMAVMWGVSWPIAMLVGGYLSDPKASRFFNPALPFWITAFVTLLALFAVIKYYTETHERQKGVKCDFLKGLRHVAFALKQKQIRPYFLTILLWTLGWGLSLQWFASYSILKFDATQQAISWSLVGQGALWMAGGTFLNPLLLKRYTSLPVALIGLSFAGVLLFFTLIPTNFWIFSFIYWISAMFVSFGFSNAMNLASINAPEGIQGKVMGLSQSMMSFGWMIVPLIGGFVGGKAAFLFYPLAGLLVLLASLVLFRQLKKST